MVLTPQQRRQRNRQEVIDTILQVARSIMREHGVAALTLNEVARQMNMRPPSLYEYFPNKMALYDRLFQLGVALYDQQLKALAARFPAPDAAEIEAHINLYIQFAIDQPELFRLLFERHVPGFVPSDNSMAAMQQVVALGMERTALVLTLSSRPEISVQQAQDLVIAVMHGLASQHLANNPDASLGQGRFASLVPIAAAMVKQALGIQS
jgi:AcrR family transcriptional regulator